VNAAKATSLADFGGMDGLVAAAKKEGALNVIALPPDWANYGEAIKGFTAKYGIPITSDQPDGSSAPTRSRPPSGSRARARRPDVFDLGAAVAMANTDKFAPYKVATWDDIPDDLKDANGLWVNDYGGYMSVGYDSAKVPAPTSVADLLKADYKGKVALNGNPTKAGAAFAGVQMVSIGQGGTAADIAKGVDFFKSAQGAGNFLPVDPTRPPSSPARHPSSSTGTTSTPVRGQAADLEGHGAQGGRRRGLLLPGDQRRRPEPGGRGLWQEYLYSDEGQNLWLKGGARPVRFEAMKTAGTLDAAAQLPHCPPSRARRWSRPRLTPRPARRTSPRTGPTPLADASRKRALGGRATVRCPLGRHPVLRLHDRLPAHPDDRRRRGRLRSTGRVTDAGQRCCAGRGELQLPACACSTPSSCPSSPRSLGR
jgi:putative spermidine/putrescine transport system substrate-binding protein